MQLYILVIKPSVAIILTKEVPVVHIRVSSIRVGELPPHTPSLPPPPSTRSLSDYIIFLPAVLCNVLITNFCIDYIGVARKHTYIMVHTQVQNTVQLMCTNLNRQEATPLNDHFQLNFTAHFRLQGISLICISSSLKLLSR